MKVKTSFTIGNSVAAVSVIALSYCKCFWNKKSCVCKHTRQITMPVSDAHIKLQPILNPMPERTKT